MASLSFPQITVSSTIGTTVRRARASARPSVSAGQSARQAGGLHRSMAHTRRPSLPAVGVSGIEADAATASEMPVTLRPCERKIQYFSLGDHYLRQLAYTQQGFQLPPGHAFLAKPGRVTTSAQCASSRGVVAVAAVVDVRHGLLLIALLQVEQDGTHHVGLQ